MGSAVLEPFNDEIDDEAIDTRDCSQLIIKFQVSGFLQIVSPGLSPGPLLTPSQNEFLSAHLQDPSEPAAKRTLCTTPDLITVIDAATGTAFGSHELRYGLRVAVIAMPAHPLWLTEAGLSASNPASFGYVGHRNTGYYHMYELTYQ
jgi:hypothetical protein